jgi:hypothetical protein
VRDNMSKVKFTTTINNEILKEIKKQAIEEDMSVGELIEKMFKKYLENSKNN